MMQLQLQIIKWARCSLLVSDVKINTHVDDGTQTQHIMTQRHLTLRCELAFHHSGCNVPNINRLQQSISYLR